jgi:type II secretory pathway pseudopilin PulG
LTLVELLLAIAILGVITGVVAATFHTAVTAWRTGTSAADATHHADAALEQVYMALRSAYYPESNTPLDKYGFTHADDGGDPPTSRDTISWVKLGNSLIGEDAPYAGVPHRVELSLIDDDGPQGPGLYVRAWRLDGQPEDFDPFEDIAPVLLSGAVVSFNCQMMDPDAKPMTYSDPIKWMDEWTETNRIPEAVQISLAVSAADRKAPPLVIERFVGIPMAELSWNPTMTSKRRGTPKSAAANAKGGQ